LLNFNGFTCVNNVELVIAAIIVSILNITYKAVLLAIIKIISSTLNISNKHIAEQYNTLVVVIGDFKRLNTQLISYALKLILYFQRIIVFNSMQCNMIVVQINLGVLSE